MIFGDGAAAVVLDRRARREARHPLDAPPLRRASTPRSSGSKPRRADLRPRLTQEMLEGAKPRIFPHMEGNYVFKHAVTRFPEVIREALAANGYSVEGPRPADPPSSESSHQPDGRDGARAPRGAGVQQHRALRQHDGLLDSAGALRGDREGRVEAGALVCLAAFGAGFTWASALIRW